MTSTYATLAFLSEPEEYDSLTRVNLETIEKARGRISGVVKNTPLVHSTFLSKLCKGYVYLKLENQQVTNSFKLRGALNRMSCLSTEERTRGIVTASTGNHALGVAFSSMHLGVPAKIVVPSNVSETKLSRLREFEVQVIQEGEFDEIEQRARGFAAEEGLTYVSPYSDVEIISGQGTIGLEILEVLDNVDLLTAPVGGGGLVSGIAVAVKSLSPSTEVVGVQVFGISTMHDSWQAGRIVHPKEKHTLADGILGGLEDGAMTFDIVMKHVDDFHLIREETVKQAIRLLWEHEKQTVEGAGAIAIGPILEDPEHFNGKTVVAVISGGNIEAGLHRRIVSEADWPAGGG
ncbi:MAG: threonine/serine dehydratase [Candidatus Thorarchaeota archaeon]